MAHDVIHETIQRQCLTPNPASFGSRRYILVSVRTAGSLNDRDEATVPWKRSFWQSWKKNYNLEIWITSPGHSGRIHSDFFPSISTPHDTAWTLAGLESPLGERFILYGSTIAIASPAWSSVDVAETFDDYGSGPWHISSRCLTVRLCIKLKVHRPRLDFKHGKFSLSVA